MTHPDYMLSQENTTRYEQRVSPADQMIIQSLAKLDGVALGIAMGALFGLGIFVATNFLLYKGGAVVGPNLALLSQFFPGYEVSFPGSLIGLFYGLITGFAVGWLIAFVRNFVLAVYMHLLKLKGSVSAVNDYIDNP
jgi:tetrahydromethanopterin S-methyltransferase subunit G